MIAIGRFFSRRRSGKTIPLIHPPSLRTRLAPGNPLCVPRFFDRRDFLHQGEHCRKMAAKSDRIIRGWEGKNFVRVRDSGQQRAAAEDEIFIFKCRVSSGQISGKCRVPGGQIRDFGVSRDGKNQLKMQIS